VSEGLALVAVWILVTVLLVSVLVAVGIAVRRIVLEHGGGNVECGLRRGQDQRWRLGLAAYQPDELRWFSAFGVRLRPGAIFARSTLSVISRRPATTVEAASLGAGFVVLECRAGGEPAGNGQPRTGAGPVELAMSEAALTGFLAWLEAGPPGYVAGLG
jgi:Protein of unknown function (DUF2550)